MTTWRDDLARVVAYGWGNGWAEQATASPEDKPRYYADGAAGIHRKNVPGFGDGTYGVMERALPDEVVGPEQDVLISMRMHFAVGGDITPGTEDDDRLDWYLQQGDHTSFAPPLVRARVEFGHVEVHVRHPTSSDESDIVLDADEIPTDTDFLIRFGVGPDYLRAKAWFGTEDDEPDWQFTTDLGGNPWPGGTYLWLDPFGAPGGGDDSDGENSYGRLYVNFVQVTVPSPLVTDSYLTYFDGYA